MAAFWLDAVYVLSASSRHLSISPTADIQSSLSLRMWTDTCDDYLASGHSLLGSFVFQRCSGVS